MPTIQKGKTSLQWWRRLKKSWHYCHYRPQHSCGKVMFLHLSVILFTGGVSALMPAGIQPPLGRHPSGQIPPQADTPLRSACWEIHMATAADGTHPTGMHSCCYLQFGSFFLPVFHLEGYTLWSCCAEVKFPFFAFYLWSPPPPPPHSNCLSGFITIFDLSRNSIIGPDRWLNILKSKTATWPFANTKG